MHLWTEMRVRTLPSNLKLETRSKAVMHCRWAVGTVARRDHGIGGWSGSPLELYGKSLALSEGLPLPHLARRDHNVTRLLM